MGSRSELGRTQWMAPSLVTGHHGLEGGGWRGDMDKKLADMSEEGYQGWGKEEQGRNLRYKRRDNMNKFIKKTVVPYPRLG